MYGLGYGFLRGQSFSQLRRTGTYNKEPVSPPSASPHGQFAELGFLLRVPLNSTAPLKQNVQGDPNLENYS